ncbi:MAG: anti-sigma factor antagonist [Defluviitaleaceae bacterium]|nr:anti-sigma factor antagonist [Defluviitaleaceae bacterium]MCL2835308.1 anti-sigma factor antagonist [Defluviitaleaceae bacterium]
MEIIFSERDRYLIAAPVGEIDHHTSLGIRQKIEKAFARSKARNLIFDFSRVEFMDSSGIGILIGRYRELSKLGGKVYAINISGEIGRIFGVSGLARIIPCYASVEDVLQNAEGQ